MPSCKQEHLYRRHHPSHEASSSEKHHPRKKEKEEKERERKALRSIQRRNMILPLKALVDWGAEIGRQSRRDGKSCQVVDSLYSLSILTPLSIAQIPLQCQTTMTIIVT